MDPAVVDLHRFHRLLEQARAAGDDEAAAVLFGQAVGMWRDEAFATLDTPWLNSVRDGLDQDRRAAELDRTDVELRLGHHTALLAALSARADADPLDERLAGQLLLALYRSGRPADALEHYQRIRRWLADELGSDPNPGLQHLHQQILNADPALAAPTHTVAAPTRNIPAATVPRQLPAPVRHFTGRTAELKALTELLDETARPGGTVVISAIGGTAGIGKTALAVQWAHQVADQFPDGQLYVNLRGFHPTGTAMTPADAVRGFLDALAVPPDHVPVDLDTQAALYRSLLAGRRILVVADNARDTEQVRPLLPGAPGCLVLVTSRNQLSGLVTAEAAHSLTLDLLSDTEAHHLLAARLTYDRLAGEPDAVEAITVACARLPLALAIVAARAAAHPKFPLAALAGELHETRARLDALTGEDGTSDVRTVFSWSYRQLTPTAARLFRLLGLHPGPDISAPAAGSLVGLSVTAVRPMLAELARAHLLVEHIPGRYTFHDLLRAYAAEQVNTVDPANERHAAVHRMLDHYLHTAHSAALLLNPVKELSTLPSPLPFVTPETLTDYGQAFAWFSTEHRVLLAAMTRSAAEFDSHICQLAWTLAEFLHRQGQWHDQAAAGLAALAAARRLADPAAQARAHRNLAYAYLPLGRYNDAHTELQRALDLFHQTRDPAGHARTFLTLAMVWGHQGRHAEALHHAQQALGIYRATAHRAGQARALNEVGWYHTLLGDHQEALTYCSQALRLHQELGNRHGQSATWDSIGHAHHHLGHLGQAITSYRNALNLLHDLGARHSQAEVLTHLGDTHHTAGDTHAARDAWQLALTILNDVNHPDAGHVRTKLQRLEFTVAPGVRKGP